MTPDQPDNRTSDRNHSHGAKKPYGKGGSGPKDSGYRGHGPKDGKRGRGPGNREYRPRDGDREHRPYNKDRRPRDGEGSGDHGHRGRDRPYGHRPHDGGRRPRDDNGSDREDRTQKGEYRPRSDDRRDRGGRPYGDRPRGDRRDDRGRSGDRGDRGYRKDDRRPRDGDRSEKRDRDETAEQESKLTIPSTPQKILFKGIDCENNGRSDLAMILYLNGAVQMSGGCRNNMERMLRDAGRDQFKTIRGRLASSCSDELMMFFDYICITLDDGYDRGFLDCAAQSGNVIAIYCKIRLDEVDGEDGMVDIFASAMISNEEMVTDGLKLLARKRKSVKASDYLKRNDERNKLRQSVRTTFVKAMKGDTDAVRRLDKLSETFPEAEFLKGYLDAYRDGTEEDYLRSGMPEFTATIVSMAPELGISETPFGKYLGAKKMQVNEEDWIQSMINAVKAGSDDALEELKPVQNRRDVKRFLASVYSARGDVASLVRTYDGEDHTYLDEYCNGNSERILEVGRAFGGLSEFDWLKRGFRGGCEECRDALIAMAGDERRQCKQLVYALHDVGADLESAKLYIAMGDNPTLPSVKWLAKVCGDEGAKEFLRSHYESKGDIATFESIFIDDGYTNKHPAGKSGRNFANGGRKKGGRGRR